MERIKMKCPICGKTEFIKIEKPYKEGMDTFIQDYADYVACTNCGLVLRFAKKYVENLLEQEYLQTDDGKKWNALKIKRDRLLKEMVDLDVQKNKLNIEAKNDNRSVARDKKIKEELSSIKTRLLALNKEINNIESEMKDIRNK